MFAKSAVQSLSYQTLQDQQRSEHMRQHLNLVLNNCTASLFSADAFMLLAMSATLLMRLFKEIGHATLTSDVLGK
jgi:hypothetical protein